MQLSEALRAQIRAGLDQRFPSGPEATDPYREPIGDAGLCGAESVAWRVHGDLPGMILGGMSALILQMLHPKAMAGVYDHSDFREDPDGRLRRTSEFIAVTTFAGRETATRMIERVRRVHGFVKGTTPAGEPYDANDPALLTWVHTAEVSSFVRAYQRYGPARLAAEEIDRYFDEVAVIAEMLGAEQVPRSAAEVRDYFASVRPELCATDQSTETLRFLFGHRVGGLQERAVYGVILQGAVGLLPTWARAMLGLRRPPGLDRWVVEPGTRGVCSLLRWGSEPSPVVMASRGRVHGPGRNSVVA